MKTIAFVSEIYTDSAFSSGGVKLNYILLDGLRKKNYTIDLYSNNIVKNKHNLFRNVRKITEFEKYKNEYEIVLSDKGVVPSDITYIHDHSYPYRISMKYNKFAHFLYKIFKKKKHKKRLSEFNLVKENLSKTRCIVVSSNVLKKDIIDNYDIKSKNIVILPPPIEKYSEKYTQNNIFTFGICAVGFERKGGYLALKAAKKLRKYSKDFRIKFIYPKKNTFINVLMKLYGIENICTFDGLYENMGEFYYSIDCLLMPSILEPFGMVATEALSIGCPVITAKHCGASDYIIDGKNGFVYDFSKHNIYGLINCMKQMLDMNDEKYNKMRNSALESVKELNSENFVKQFLDIMNN